MSDSPWKRKAQTGAAWILGGVCLIFVAVMGLWVYMAASAKPLHPNLQDVPSVTTSSPLPRWASAVQQARLLARTRLAEKNLPGLSVAVGSGGDILWAEGFGWADVEKHLTVAPGTPFRIGTASTALTSAAVGLLVERGRLDLDDAIQVHVPDYPEKKWPVTVRALMGHLAGVGTDGGDEGPLYGEHCERPVDALRFFAQDSLRFEPGTQYRYSSYGWILLSAAVEAAAGEPFLEFMQQQVFAPLGMADTMADSATAPIANRATPYFPKFASDPRYGPDLMRPVDYSCYAGSSVFLSTPSDLVRFAMAMDEGKLLQPKTVKLLQTTQRLPSGEETGYGLGWDLESVEVAGKPTTLIGHDGDSLGGMVASFMTFPEYGLVVAVTSNTSYADTYALAVQIAGAFASAGSRPAGK